MISTKSHYVKLDGWRGYEQPINAVCGASDTGTWSDSPCPSTMRQRELKLATSILRKNHIKYRTIWKPTSNVFCIHFYVLVSPSDKEQSKQLLEHLLSETNLLFLTK